MSSDRFAERILRFVGAKGYTPQQLREVAHALGVGADEMGDFHAACKALMKTGRVIMGSSQALTLPEPGGRVIGTYRANPRGFGFVIPDTPNAHGDLYVPAKNAGGAITGDTVAARVLRRGKRQGKMLLEGRIVEIIKRGQSRFVGEVCHNLGRWYINPDGRTLHVPIIIADPGAKGARRGELVVVEIVEYPEAGGEARGVIVNILGPRGRPDVVARGIVEQYQLPDEFADATIADAQQVVAGYAPTQEMKTREDLRKLTVITIDPTDARDFDDAISITRNKDGSIELGVHIADVAHFVREGSPLDDEANHRANSVYLPNLVIPMLPEVLSNGLCSLQERQPRLAKSVFITYTARGAVKKTRAANTVIRSAKRLTYQQASRILDGKPGRTSAKVVALLADMELLARRIQKRRRRDGMLALELPEVELVHDETGRVVDVTPADTSFSHTIIEMFMVEANEAVARILLDTDAPYLRRIHDAPSPATWATLTRFLSALGHDLPKAPDRSAVQTLLAKVHGKGESFAVNLAVLRSMQQAVYSPLPIGHYALGSENYCHFTSPIRRYPDLTIHRMLDRHLSTARRGRQAARTDGGLDRGDIPTEEDLRELGVHCSRMERQAESAERELKQVYVLQLLETQVGHKFDGVVTGVANMGVFVQLTRYLIEGLLRFDDLPDDWWEVDASRGTVIGARSGRRIAIGDKLAVVIGRVNVPNRQLELALASPLLPAGKATKTARPSRKRKQDTGGSPRRGGTRAKSPPKKASRGRAGRKRK